MRWHVWRRGSASGVDGLISLAIVAGIGFVVANSIVRAGWITTSGFLPRVAVLCALVFGILALTRLPWATDPGRVPLEAQASRSPARCPAGHGAGRLPLPLSLSAGLLFSAIVALGAILYFGLIRYLWPRGAGATAADPRL
jgi:hypothetical protein